MLRIPNIFLIGPMGAGKTTIGRLLAQELQYEFYDSDNVIEKNTGADINWIFDLEGEAGFRAREQKIIDTLTQKKHIVLATGGGAVISATNRANLASRGTVIYLSVSVEQQIVRVSHDTKRPLLHDKDVKQRLTELANEREQLYIELADMTFSTNNQSARTIVNQITKSLS